MLTIENDKIYLVGPVLEAEEFAVIHDRYLPEMTSFVKALVLNPDTLARLEYIPGKHPQIRALSFNETAEGRRYVVCDACFDADIVNCPHPDGPTTLFSERDRGVSMHESLVALYAKVPSFWRPTKEV